MKSHNNPAGILGLVRPVAESIAPLTVGDRITLLMALLAQELCNLPLNERDAALAEVLRDMPKVLDATEEGMRLALAANARSGL